MIKDNDVEKFSRIIQKSIKNFIVLRYAWWDVILNLFYRRGVHEKDNRNVGMFSDVLLPVDIQFLFRDVEGSADVCHGNRQFGFHEEIFIVFNGVGLEGQTDKFGEFSDREDFLDSVVGQNEVVQPGQITLINKVHSVNQVISQAEHFGGGLDGWDLLDLVVGEEDGGNERVDILKQIEEGKILNEVVVELEGGEYGKVFD